MDYILEHDIQNGENIAALIEHLRNSESGAWIMKLSGELLNHPLIDDEIDVEWTDTLQRLQHRTLDTELVELTEKARAGKLDDGAKKRLLALLKTKADRKS